MVVSVTLPKNPGSETNNSSTTVPTVGGPGGLLHDWTFLYRLLVYGTTYFVSEGTCHWRGQTGEGFVDPTRHTPRVEESLPVLVTPPRPRLNTRLVGLFTGRLCYRSGVLCEYK